jgi:hypothetical protein
MLLVTLPVLGLLLQLTTCRWRVVRARLSIRNWLLPRLPVGVLTQMRKLETGSAFRREILSQPVLSMSLAMICGVLLARILFQMQWFVVRSAPSTSTIPATDLPVVTFLTTVCSILIATGAGIIVVGDRYRFQGVCGGCSVHALDLFTRARRVYVSWNSHILHIVDATRLSCFEVYID